MTDDDFNAHTDAWDSHKHLDVLLDCDDDRLDTLVDLIYNDVCFEGHKSKVKPLLRLLLMNFIVLKKRKPSGWLRCGRSNGYWAAYNKRFPNPWNVTGKIDDIIDDLHTAGYVNINLGMCSEDHRRQTRIQPSKYFVQTYIKPHKMLNIPVRKHLKAPLVIVHTKEQNRFDRHKTDHHRYEATGRTAIPNQLKEMKDQLKRYNGFLRGIEIRLKNLPETQDAIKQIDFTLDKHVYRVFSDPDMQTGGRFYGGWWIGLKSDLRKHILINGNSTIEIDYQSQHAHLIYGVALNKPISDILGANVDAYTLEGYPRDLGKAIFVRALYHRNRNELKHSLENYFKDNLNSKNDDDKALAQYALPIIQSDDEFETLMIAFEHKHQALLQPTKYLYPQKDKWWGKFQYYDSQIAMYVLDTLTKSGITALSVHDSFIVEKQYEDNLKQAMKDAYKHVSLIDTDLKNCIPSNIINS